MEERKGNGKTGIRRFGGILYEEFLPELRGARGCAAFTEMSENDPTIGGIMFAIENLLRQTDFRVEPEGTTEKDKEAAEFIEQCMNDMCMTWQDTISEVLSFLTFGWSYHEIVYKRRNGRSRNESETSKYDDGLIGWKKIPIRGQDTLFEWRYKDDTDDITGMVQMPPPDYGQIFIPIEKALHFKTRSRKNNPEGRSILRSAYRPWYFKKRMEEIEGIGVERDLAGFPVLNAPEGVDLWDTQDPEMVAALARAESIVTGIRRDAREGLVMPFGWELKLLSSGSRSSMNTNEIINRYDQRIATSVLADFILLGQQGVGSFALSSDKTRLFALACGTYLDIICEVFTNQAIPRLIDLNGEHFKGITGYPKMTHGDIEDADLASLSAFIKDMVGVGALTPDAGLDDYLREAAHLPERVEGDYAAPADQEPKKTEQKKPDTAEAQTAAEEQLDEKEAEDAKKSLYRTY